MVEGRADGLRSIAIGQHFGPVEQQIIVVEHLRRLLGFDIAGEECQSACNPDPRLEWAPRGGQFG